MNSRENILLEKNDDLKIEFEIINVEYSKNMFNIKFKILTVQ